MTVLVVLPPLAETKIRQWDFAPGEVPSIVNSFVSLLAQVTPVKPFRSVQVIPSSDHCRAKSLGDWFAVALPTSFSRVMSNG